LTAGSSPTCNLITLTGVISPYIRTSAALDNKDKFFLADYTDIYDCGATSSSTTSLTCTSVIHEADNAVAVAIESITFDSSNNLYYSVSVGDNCSNCIGTLKKCSGVNSCVAFSLTGYTNINHVYISSMAFNSHDALFIIGVDDTYNPKPMLCSSSLRTKTSAGASCNETFTVNDGSGVILPGAISIDSRGHIYISDQINGTTTKYTPPGYHHHYYIIITVIIIINTITNIIITITTV